MDIHPGTYIDKKLRDGETYNGFLVIHTPRHTEGHIALLEREEGVLIAGDAFRVKEGRIMLVPNKYNIDPL